MPAWQEIANRVLEETKVRKTGERERERERIPWNLEIGKEGFLYREIIVKMTPPLCFGLM